jgi:hypothetical protein
LLSFSISEVLKGKEKRGKLKTISNVSFSLLLNFAVVLPDKGVAQLF